MVQIKPQSPIDQAKQPFMFEWDSLRRRRHNDYEEKINESLFQLQKLDTMSAIYRVFYPHYHQHHFLELQIYKNLQAIGEFTEEELANYEGVNPRIRGDVKQVFNFNFPLEGFAVGVALQAIPIKFRMSLPNNVILLAAPMILQWGYRKHNIGYKHRVNQFLDWALERRKGKGQLELLSGEINTEQLAEFKQNFHNSSALKLFKQYNQL